jgi:predicted metal-dependent HD superfamily phosphohydrolase
VSIKDTIMKSEFLRIIWHKKLSPYTEGMTGLVSATYDELIKHYTTNRRYYHNLNHVVDLLNQLKQYEFQINDWESVYLAIWFHDSVYVPNKPGNEEKSAELARKFLNQTRYPPARIEKVIEYILATQNHEVSEDASLDFQYFLDFDLSILGSDETIYDTYAKQIRDEYFLYPNFMYNRGRKKVLQHFLDKPFIFKTDDYRAKFEDKARENLQRELSRL